MLEFISDCVSGRSPNCDKSDASKVLPLSWTTDYCISEKSASAGKYANLVYVSTYVYTIYVLYINCTYTHTLGGSLSYTPKTLITKARYICF